MLSISSQRTNLKKKAVKMLVLVVLLYVMCWSPLQVFTLIIREDDNIKTSQVIGIKYYLEVSPVWKWKQVEQAIKRGF